MSNINNYLKSPFNYTGGKHKLLNQLIPLFPENIDSFIDLFSGGCNVGINVKAKRKVFIDFNIHLINLLHTFKKYTIEEILSEIDLIISMYGLSESSKNGYEFYACSSSSGLATYNKDKYNLLRQDYNSIRSLDSELKINMMLYTLIIFGFNNQIRFNKKGQFNIPVGKRDFNDKIKTNLILFINNIQHGEVEFKNTDFKNLSPNFFKDTFVYADPPYLITTAAYNESGGWTEECETKLYALLDELNNAGTRFALSNVIENKGVKNRILENWILTNNYFVHYLKINYNNSNYQIKDRSKETIEILVTNY